jgi:photosystem II stability/assembly factor-like uncharacterized protein
VHPTNPDVAYAAVLGDLFKPTKERGVYRTRDGGATWQPVFQVSDRTGAVDLTMDPKNPDVLIAGLWTVERKPWTIESGSAEGGLVRTTDGGNTWTRLQAGLPKGRVGRVGVSISGADSRRVYAQVEADNDEGGTFRSDDGGLSWTRTFAGRALQQRAWYYTHIVADPVDVDTVYALNVGAFKSTDGGRTFQGGAIQSHSDHHDLWINPRNNRALVGGNDGGGTVSLDGSPWTGQNNQPTSELYRLTADTRWPYWVYGAQQDNSTIAAPSQGNETPYPVGGGESGHIAVDPRDFNIVYAGSYGGALTRMDRKTGLTTDVRIYNDMQTGQRAADMKYRQQWNAPIRISRHAPDVVYTTSQYVHRTTNGGLDWTVISPDLTRNDERRQQYSGGEGITRDNTGVEVYGTVFAIEESPIAPGVIWAGSDDGLVHVSRDSGKTWQNVTGAGWPEGCINSIDPSPHDPARATIAMYRYRQGDQTPYLYQTNDYGRTWRRLADGTNGIPRTYFTRVVREDPVRRGLLYAGTEFGFFVSLNDGARWHQLQMGLPITPVTDMLLYRDDLIVTTQGRGFWILDNLAPLRTPPTPGASIARLYKPEDGYRAGAQPPTFFYWFADTPAAPVTVEVVNGQGVTVFSASAQPGAALPTMSGAPGGGEGRGGRGGGGGRGGVVGPGAGGTASALKGLNRATWTGMRLPSLYTVPPGTVMWGGGPGQGQGPKVPPGMYTVRVSAGTWTESQTFRLRPDPRMSPVMTDAEGAEQLRMANEIGGLIKTLYDQVARIRDVKAQAADRAAKAGAGSPVATAARTLRDRLEAVEGDMTQMRGEGGQDALNFPGRMDNQLITLYGAIVQAERRLGSAVTERYRDLKPQADDLARRAATALKADVDAFNAAAAKAGVAPVVVK